MALVIGQSAYRAVPALPNAENDGKRMAELLGSAGFDVTAAPDQSQNDMRQTISNFAAKVASSGPDTVALVFYAGHGLQIDGENYLVPVDVDPKREADIPLQAVRLNDLLNTLGALPTRMRIVMLDACRNNPFPALSQTAGHGLAVVDTKAGAPGSFISYSTSPGSEAEDGAGTDSPYTTAVLSIAKEPNLPIEEAFKRVRVAVNQATDGRQNSLGKLFPHRRLQVLSRGLRRARCADPQAARKAGANRGRLARGSAGQGAESCLRSRDRGQLGRGL